ncbi:hypothetical protein BB560_002958 [Smittium megazygosporum]|uniref:Uncharacterized protein n=1 Tax=Smittium megazygosporum TaxID=133381 RepID=A0A2T9ZDD5_9FUNG|nr:hypothetical protein BB560_002958 [Smittium megazygosporum]
MRFTLAGLILAASSACTIAATEVPENNLNKRLSLGDDIKTVLDNRLEGHGGHRGHRGRRGHRGVGYWNRGRYWYWDSPCDDVFIRTLKIRPTHYWGQRFQYCYLYVPGFATQWNTSVLFRRRWNSDAAFRTVWFGRVRYTTWRRV